MKSGQRFALPALNITRAETKWHTASRYCVTGLSKNRPESTVPELLHPKSFASLSPKNLSSQTSQPRSIFLALPRNRSSASQFPQNLSLYLQPSQHKPYKSKGFLYQVYYPVFLKTSCLGTSTTFFNNCHKGFASTNFTMSGKSWFSLSSWYGSGSQAESASSEGKEEGAKAKDSKGERNGEAGARGGSEGASSSGEHKRHEKHNRHGDHGHHGHRKKHKSGSEDDGEIKYPAVDTYGPCTIRGSDLIPGKKMKWCTCGLSLKAPWCDGRHKKTGFKSLKWEVPEEPQAVYQFCNCQYTKTPPFCDGTHTNLPEVVEARQKNCPHRDSHEECQKLCTGCGFKVDF